MSKKVNLNFFYKTKRINKKIEQKHFKESGKWVDIEYLDLKDRMKTIFKYWDKNAPINKIDKKMRKWVQDDWDKIKKKVDSRDKDENVMNNIESIIIKIKIERLKYYNFKGIFNIEILKADHPTNKDL